MGNTCLCKNKQTHIIEIQEIDQLIPGNQTPLPLKPSEYIKSQIVTTNPCSQFVSWNYEDDILVEKDNKLNLDWNQLLKTGKIKEDTQKTNRTSIVMESFQSSEPNLNSHILTQLNKLGFFQRDSKLDNELKDIQIQKGTRLLNGDIYTGQVYNGIKWGFGTLYEEEGGYYEGYFFNDKFHGKGRYVSPEGDAEFGTWFNNMLIGKSTYIDMQGNLYSVEEDIYDRAEKLLEQKQADFVTKMGFKYYGSKIDGKKEGFGVWVWPDGTRCYGNFIKNLLEGYGVQLKEGELLYEGQFRNGEYDGIGTVRYEEGVFYKGQLSMGKREGYGALIWDDGKSFRGFFHDDKPFGPGRLIDQYGNISNGLWSV